MKKLKSWIEYRLVWFSDAYLRRKEKVAIWIAWHLPRWLVYWCAIRLLSEMTKKDEMVGVEVPNMKAMDLLSLWT